MNKPGRKSCLRNILGIMTSNGKACFQRNEENYRLLIAQNPDADLSKI